MQVFVDKKILIISTEDWDHPTLSKHQYARTLSMLSNDVYFLNPVGRADNIRQVAPHLWVIDYLPVMPGLNRLPEWLSNRFRRHEVRRIEALAGTCFDIVWTFDPFRFQDPQVFHPKLSLYYAADRHHITRQEWKLANAVNLVLAPSVAILDHIKTDRSKIKINHAVADYFFDQHAITSLPGSAATKVLYVGNLNSRFLDHELLRQVVQYNRHCDFIFVGNNERADNTWSQLENVYFAGRKNNEELPAMLKAADVLLLCYDTDRYYEEASNSHKIMEYLSAGSVIVSTRIMEYASSDLLIMPKRKNDLPKLLSEVVSNLDYHNAEDRVNERISHARRNTYALQLKGIDEALSKFHLSGK